MVNRPHPLDPQSNVSKFRGYDSNKYALDKVSLTVLTDESLTPGRPPCLTQNTIGKFLQPLTRELVEVPPRPTIDELPDAVIDRMVKRDKAFWVDKPGANAYSLHDAYYNYEMRTEQALPNRRALFPRSYQYDLDCVRYRRRHACDDPERKTSVSTHCRDCQKLYTPGLTPFQVASTEDPGQKRWKYYPDLTTNMPMQEIRKSMKDVGRPFQNEACNWYYDNYPPVKYDCIIRKFSNL